MKRQVRRLRSHVVGLVRQLLGRDTAAVSRRCETEAGRTQGDPLDITFEPD